MKISVIVPVYNEQKTLKKILSLILKQKSVGEVIVVNDGSTDNSSKILKTLNSSKVKIINHPTNFGKGRALKSGIMKASKEHLIVQDADLEYDPKQYDLLIGKIS